MTNPVFREARASVVEPLVETLIEQAISPPELTLGHLMEKLVGLIREKVIQDATDVRTLLERKYSQIETRNRAEPFGLSEQRFYNLSCDLIDTAGVINSYCLERLKETHLDEGAQDNETFRTSQIQIREKLIFQRIEKTLGTFDYNKAALTILTMPSLDYFQYFLETSVKPSHLLPLAQALTIQDKTRAERLIATYFPSFQTTPPIAFGKEDWNIYIGEIGVEPSLPLDIETILEEPDPYQPERKLKDNYLLTLIPKTVNGRPLTLAEIAHLPQENLGTREKLKIFYGYDIDKHLLTPPPTSYWALVRRKLLPGSILNYYGKKDVAHRFAPNYRSPRTLEAAIAFFTNYLKNGWAPTSGHLFQCAETVPTLNQNLGYAYVQITNIGSTLTLNMASGYLSNPPYTDHGALACRVF